MTITIDSTPVQSIYVGSTPVQAVYVGSNLVWPAGTTYYKWGYDNNWTYCYTTSSTPSVGDRMAQKIGNVLCYTAQIVAVSSNSFTTYAQDESSSGETREWYYVGTEAIPQSQPATAYEWMHSPPSFSTVVTVTRNPAVGDIYYNVNYREVWSGPLLGNIASVTTSGGNVVSFVPSSALAGVYYEYVDVYQPAPPGPTPTTWYKWLSGSGIPNYYIYTGTRNPVRGDYTYDKDGSSYVLSSQGRVGKVDTSGGNVTTIWTSWDGSSGYSWSYSGVA